MIKLCCLYLLPIAVASLANAHDSEGSNTNFRAGRSFREDLSQGIVLTATSNAPARASGRAQMVAVDNNGTNSTLLFVKTSGLTNGQYHVTVTDVSGSNTYSLGSLNVPASWGWHRSRWGEERDDWGRFGGDRHENNWANWVGRLGSFNSAFTNLLCSGGATNLFYRNARHWFTNTLSAGSGSFVLPSALVPTNVAGVFVSDSAGAVALTGDFTGATNSTTVYIETVGLVPGTATNVQGHATLTLISRSGTTYGTFKLSASGLEARQKLYLTANETNTFKVYTSRSGTLYVGSLPRTKVINLQTVVATDVSSNVVFSVSF